MKAGARIALYAGGAAAAGAGIVLLAEHFKAPTQPGQASLGVAATSASASVSVAQQTLPAMTVGQPFLYAWQATGGSGSYSWTAAGSLPPGLTLSSAGVLRGTPAVPGTYALTVTATDANGNSASRSTKVTVKTATASSGATAPYRAAWTASCKTVLLDSAGNIVAGVSPYAVATTGGTASFGGFSYTWGACPSASGSASGGGTTVGSSSSSTAIAAIQAQIAQAQASLASLQTQLSSLESQYQVLHQQNVASRSRIASLQSQYQSIA